MKHTREQQNPLRVLNYCSIASSVLIFYFKLNQTRNYIQHTRLTWPVLFFNLCRIFWWVVACLAVSIGIKSPSNFCRVMNMAGASLSRIAEVYLLFFPALLRLNLNSHSWMRQKCSEGEIKVANFHVWSVN